TWKEEAGIAGRSRRRGGVAARGARAATRSSTADRRIAFRKGQQVEHSLARKIGRPIEGGLNTVAACKSADQRDPFLGCRFNCGSGLCRKLEHCCFLIFKHVR